VGQPGEVGGAGAVARPDAVVALGGAPRTVTTTNPLLRAAVPGTLGLKTGTSPSAGRCLIAVVRQDGRRLAAILLRSADPGGDARALLRRAA
jgi:D-alanyl-D-alanine carboxypeptidase (penicillin-binding protein 5/6)